MNNIYTIKKSACCLLLSILVLAAAMPVTVFAKANLSDLYESPKDRTSSATDPEYDNLQSYVYDGIPGVTAAGGAELIFALGAGGLATFDYDSGTPAYGLLDRETTVNYTGEDEQLFVTRVVADDMNASPSTEYDRVYALSGDYLYTYTLSTAGLLASPQRIRIYDPADPGVQYEPTDLVIVNEADAASDITYLAVAAKRQDGTGGAVFLIYYDESDGDFVKDNGEPDFDILPTGFSAISVAAVNANVDGSAAQDYLFIAGPDNLWIRYITLANIGGTSTADAFNTVGSATFDGTVRDVTVYANAAVDSAGTDAADSEVLVFMAANTGVIVYELDYDSGYVVQERGNLTLSDLPDLDAYGVGFGSMTTNHADGRSCWLVVGAGSQGVYVFQTGGGDDSYSLTVKSRLDTTGTTEKIFYVNATDAATPVAIPNIYVADGGGGFKDMAGATMDTDPQVTLAYQWDESVAPAAIQAFQVNSANYYAFVLDQAGGLKLYDVNTDTVAPAPQVEAAAQGGKYGFDLAWNSKYSAEGSGSNLAGTPYDICADESGGTATNVNVFVAAGSAGVKKMQLTAVGTALVYEESGNPVESYNTPGSARGVDAYEVANDQYRVVVADGDAGIQLMDYNLSTANVFTLNRQIALQGAGVAEDVLIDHRASDDFVYVAYGDRGLLAIDVTDSTAFDKWSNPSTAVMLDSSTMGGYVKKLALGNQGTDTYYLYCLVQTSSGTTIIKVVNVSTPSSASVTGEYKLETEANDLAFLPDSSNTGKYYLVVSSTNDTELGQTSRVVTVNVSDPANPVSGSILGVTGQAQAVGAQDLGAGSGLIVVGEAMSIGTVNSYAGQAGRAKVTFTGAQTITVSVAANPNVVALGGSSTLNASVSGGESPYIYNWSASARTSSETGTFSDNGTAQSLTWTAPAGVADIFTLTVKVTDNDGNTGTGSVTVRARPTGVSVVNRIGKAGSQVTVPIEVSGIPDTPIDAWGLEVTFDPSLLSFIEVVAPTDLAGWSVSGDEVSAGTLRIAGYAESFDKVIEAGATKTLILLRFSISNSAAPGTIVTITPSKAVDDIAGVDLTAGQFKIVCPGDVDGSGLLTPQDSLWTFYYFLGVYDLEEDEAKVGDVNNDGVTDVADALEIMNRYIAYGGQCPSI
jgi:hypothetical protein